MVYFASFSLFCLFFLFLLPLIANKVDLEALERIRGFSTTMRYINRHYLSIYLSYLKLCACIDIGKGDIDPPLLGILCTFVNTLSCFCKYVLHRAGKNLGFLEFFYRFLGFLGFFRFFRF